MDFWDNDEELQGYIAKANESIHISTHGFNLTEIKKSKWTVGELKRWYRHKHNKRRTGHLHRIKWTPWEFLHFIRAVGNLDQISGRTGDEIGQALQFDRLTNDDVYSLGTVIQVPIGVNFAKRRMPEFQVASSIPGQDPEERKLFTAKVIRERCKLAGELTRAGRDR